MKPLGQAGRGLSAYRQYYGLGRDDWLNWRPSKGPRINERSLFGSLDKPRVLPGTDGLRILVVGELGFNPERILAFEEQGHKLYGLWIPWIEAWDSAGPFPYGNVEDVPLSPGWRDRIRAIKPDVIYALLNWQALPLINEVIMSAPGAPVVFHFKESPFHATQYGLWPMLINVISRSDGLIFINNETRAWFELKTGWKFDASNMFILDGDLPKVDYMVEDWSPKLSQQDGEIHTACVGVPRGFDRMDFSHIAKEKIHIHFYGEHYHQLAEDWVRRSGPSGYLHLHATVEPTNWVRELSRYDAGWLHLFKSNNRGSLRRADWADLNLPARLSTYAIAGLPWIMKDNGPSITAVQALARRHDVGFAFNDIDDLARELRNKERLDELSRNMRMTRHMYSFDYHVDDLITFFRHLILGHASKTPPRLLTKQIGKLYAQLGRSRTVRSIPDSWALVKNP
jgi:hypothetical protein